MGHQTVHYYIVTYWFQCYSYYMRSKGVLFVAMVTIYRVFVLFGAWGFNDNTTALESPDFNLQSQIC